ncbi:MAG: hypothetical protein DSM107014_13440, partial [Gomphosphaeria aponina SAG 52.96 = DSM 107014]|nr:hypothetical protein [Gomphosphaeria aponina SAG 52.96 = DSM 107014]
MTDEELKGMFSQILQQIGGFEQKIGELDKKVEVGFTKVDGELKRLEEKIDSNTKRLEEKIDSSVKRLDEKIEFGLKNVTDQIDSIDRQLEDTKFVSRATISAILIGLLDMSEKLKPKSIFIFISCKTLPTPQLRYSLLKICMQKVY